MKDMDMNLFLVLDSRTLTMLLRRKAGDLEHGNTCLFGILAAVTKFTKRRKDL